MTNISLFWREYDGRSPPGRRVGLGRGFEGSRKIVEFTHRIWRENLTQSRVVLRALLKLEEKLEIQPLFLSSISPSHISLFNYNSSLTPFLTKWMKTAMVLSLPKWPRRHCTPSGSLDTQVGATQDVDDPTTLCKYVQITWQHCTSVFPSEKQKSYYPPYKTIWINGDDMWINLEHCLVQRRLSINLTSFHKEGRIIINVLKWMEKGIIVDDKIMGNRAKDWEGSLLSRFSSQRKTHEKPRQRWRWMLLKKDSPSIKVWRRARETLKHH